MTSERDERKVSIIIMPDWGPAPRSLVIPWRRARAMAVGIPLIMVGLAVMAVSWIFLAMKAGTADDLQAENLALIASRDSMAVLAERLAGLEARETQLRVLSGLERSPDAALWLPGAPGAAAGEWNPAGDTAVSPTMWPLTERGFVTQSLLAGDEGGHPGIDIAVASGSYVRAAGGGEVVEAAEDPVYGRFVLIDHGNGLWSRYGHALYLVVTRGQSVRRGEVIAISGSTGRSTAPHLHFEILRNGRPIDPLSMVTPP